MRVRIFGAFLLCIMVLAVAIGCSSSGGKAPNGMTATEILAKYQNASIAMDTLQLRMTATMSAMGGKITVNTSGSVDKLNYAMYMSENMSMTSPAFTFNSESYTLNNWMYMYDPVKAKWVKTQFTEDLWDRESNLGYLSEFLNHSADAKYIGTETIGGISCYKISVKPNWDVVENVLTSVGFNLSDLGNVSLSDIIKNTSCTVWIDENTYYPMKESIAMTMVIEGVTASENVIGTISNINHPVNIVLPAAAQNATAISYSDFVAGNY